MKKQVTVLGSLCAGAMIAGASIGPAEARTVSGFASFHVEIQESQQTLGLQGAYECLVEDWGAVVNRCSSNVNLAFELAIDDNGLHQMQVQDYWSWPAGTAPFSCIPYTYSAAGSSGSAAGSAANFTGASQDQPASIYSPTGTTYSIQLICWNVPPGAGIASITWGP